MKKNLLLVAGLWAAVSCAPHNSTPSSNDPSSQITDGGDGTKPRPPEACYPGIQTKPVCFSLVQRTTIGEGKTLYNYPDPSLDPSFPRSFNKDQYLPPDRLLDLRTVAASLPLSAHFERDELMQENATRGFYGLFSIQALTRLEAIRTELGRSLVITSGYRSPGYNSQVDGSAQWSRHTYGDAADFHMPGVSLKKLAETCMKHGASFYQLYKSHVHCDWRNASLDRTFYPGPVEIQPTDIDLHLKAQELGKIVSHVDNSQGTLVLTTEMRREDEDELLHEWEILHSNGQRWTGEEAMQTLPLISGQYQIHVQLGGSLSLETEVLVP